jgi:hypothetical protein
MSILNEYNEVGSFNKFIVQANNPKATILANPQACRIFIANDTGEIIAFDKDLNPIIAGGSDLTLESLVINATAVFDEEYDNGNSGTTKTIDWNNGNKQLITMTGNCTFTFTAPPGACNLVLRFVQDGTGSRVATWPATVRAPGGADEMLLSQIPASVDIVCLYWNGTTYYATINKDFLVNG